MNTKQIKYVLVLANEGSFSRAAEVLNIKQPTLSQFIKKLETEIGMKLFDRSSGEVCLTDAGKVYIEVGRKVLDMEHQMEGRFSDLADNKTGNISIGISAHRSVALIPPVVVAFKARYPGITLHIVERNRSELIDAAVHGEFDLVITTMPVDTDIFCYETVFVEENVLAIKQRLPSETVTGRKHPVIPASTLNHRSFAMLNADHLMQRELDDLSRAYGLDLKKEVECTSLEALVEMAKTGIGAAFIPSCLARDPALNYYSIKEVIPQREIVVMYRKDQYLSKAVLDLKQIIHELLK